jgi:serine phosphatase RsbU (regulator of sigma subunit)/predicted enzyme related to lactoylglutathione lyase
MHDGHAAPEDSEANANPWLKDKIVSHVPGPDTTSGRDREAVRVNRDEAYIRLQFVRVFVRDQERSLRFFVEQLGFRLMQDIRFASGNRWIEVAPPDGTASLALVLPEKESDDEHLVGHFNAVTFLAEDVEAKYQDWLKRGVQFTLPLQRPAFGGVFCEFLDPDGNTFVLAGFDEATRTIEAHRKAYAEHLEAKGRAEQELEIARQVQSRLFPQEKPDVPSLDYAGVCIQARTVGGDYYDFLELGENRLALVVGDISGKGMAAALLMANLQANLRSQHLVAGGRTDQLLNSVNRLLFRNSDSASYATLFFAEFDVDSARLRYANCGHVPAMLIRANGDLERLEPTCTVLGLFKDWNCLMAETSLGEADVLALCTDGVTEAVNELGEDFGESGLIDALRRNLLMPAEELAQTIVREVVRFSGSVQQDDITLIVAKRMKSEQEAPSA